MIRKLFLFSLLTFIAVLDAQSKIDNAIENLENNYSQEKVYLLLDKNKYLNGENIWFKSFVFDGYHLSSISTTLFVELYDQEKKLLDKKKIMLKDGEGDGSFTLAESLPENVYFLRAYTPWMANFPEEFQSIQSILVYNPDSPKALKIDENTDWTANVFPESGTFVESIQTKIAVRLHQSGIPTIDWSGYLIDKEKPTEKLTSFKAFDENVASFSVTPKPDKEYQVVIEDAKGGKQIVDLPSVAKSGVSLKVNSDKEGVFFKLKGVNLPESLKNYRIIGTINNRLAYSANIVKPIKEFSYHIPPNINQGLNGVLLLTIFNHNNLVVAQRLCFIKPDDLNMQKPVIAGLPFTKVPRSNTMFEISKENGFKNYSVLIKSNEDSEKTRVQNNLLSTLWLTGDFKSQIENPTQYFSNKHNSEALDALLITEKWNRFDWNKLLTGTIPTIKHKPQRYLSYRGKLALNSVALKNTSVNLFMQSGTANSSIFQGVTDESGYLYLDNIEAQDSLKINYFLNVDKDRKISVPDNLTMVFQPMVDFVPLKGELPSVNYHLIDRNLNSEVPKEIARALTNKNNRKTLRDNEILIEEIKIKVTKIHAKSKLNKELSRGLFSSMNSMVFDFVNENQDARSYNNVLQWLQGRAAGLTFQMDNFGSLTPYIRGAKAGLFLDENTVDPSTISSISIGDIAMVKIFKGSPMVGNAVVVYLRKGNMKSANEDEKSLKKNKVVLAGYDKALPFLQPNFEDDSYKKITNDTRDLLYWNPSLSSDSNLPLSVKFLTNDSAKNYKITIISFNRDGIPLFYDEVAE